MFRVLFRDGRGEIDDVAGFPLIAELDRADELAYAEKYGKPVHIFYNRLRTSLSAMLTGDAYFTIHPYDREDEIFAILEDLLTNI